MLHNISVILFIWNCMLFNKHSNIVQACNGLYSDFCDNTDQVYKNNVDDGSNYASLLQKEIDKTPLILDEIPGGEIVLDRSIRSFRPYRREKELSLQITTILDELLFESGYDRQIRPQLEGPPLEVDCCYVTLSYSIS